jgi:cardiolipin synthase
MNHLFEILANWWHIIIPLVISAIELVGLASAIHAALKVRTSQAAVAWAAGLVALPLIVVPLYWVFGRNRFGGYRAAIQQVATQHKASVEAVRRELMTEMNADSASSDSPVARLADVLDTPLSDGNVFELLIDGKAFFDSLLQQISSAENYVYAQFYTINDDTIGNQFADALCERAEAGISVRLLYDEVGCFRLPKSYLLRLRSRGVEVQAFNTRQGWANRFQLNFRNHRKLLVVDGKRAITGGLNIGDEYLGHVSWASRWRDTAIRVDGPAARKLQAVFATDYYWATRHDLPEAVWSFDNGSETGGEFLPGVERKVLTTFATVKKPTGLAAVCATGPADQRPRATMMFATAAGAAEQRLWISSPYLVPDETCITALSMARARGVDVRILIPSKADQWLVYLAGFYYERVFESFGISVYRYDDGFLHQKCVLVDDRLALIGSTNLDNRSLHLNFELMLAADEPKLVEQVAEMLERDFASAKKTNKEIEHLLPWYIRGGTIIARLFSPIL